MFGQIAKEYDKLNHIMSLDIDKSWRKKAIRQMAEPAPGDAQPLRLLDVACGTGDFSIAAARSIPGCRVTGVDVTEEMLAVMAGKVASAGLSEQIVMQVGDGENLPFADDSFDRVSIAFGIRNFEHRDRGLQEMLRVLRPGGRLVILELSEPENRVIRWLYELYFLHILPWIGGLISGDRAAYRYLPASVVKFPPKDVFLQMMREAGFSDVAHRAFTLGICRMYTGVKADR